MTYLSLFTGAGGGDLACQHLLGWACKGYVEIDDYCQRLIRQRQDDGVLDRAPIFGDIKAFIGDGYAAGYSGMVDCVTGGPPCQPWSVAGKRAGSEDYRDMWPDTLAVIHTVRPRFCFLENVCGLLAGHGYFGRILAQLDASGFDVRWDCIPAAYCNAHHKRDRVWIVADRERPRLERGWLSRMESPAIVARHERLTRLPKPHTVRRRNDVPFYMDRIKAAGNAHVPAVAATAWLLLAGDVT